MLHVSVVFFSGKVNCLKKSIILITAPEMYEVISVLKVLVETANSND